MMTSDLLNSGDRLAQLFDEIHNNWNAKQESFSPTSDEMASDLSLPKDSKTTLCYFVITRDYLPFYRSNIFPIFEKYGFDPIVLIDVVKTGENMLVKIQSIIERSYMIVIDASSSKEQYQYELSLALGLKKKIIIIKDEYAKLPSELKDEYVKVPLQEKEDIVFIIERPQNLYSESVLKFIDDLDEHLASHSLDNDLYDEPRRLLNKHEYRAAVISAFSLLESVLRLKLESKNIDKSSSLRKLFDYAIQSKLIHPNNANELRYFHIFRNELVHRSIEISQDQATNIVNFIMNMISDLRRS